MLDMPVTDAYGPRLGAAGPPAPSVWQRPSAKLTVLTAILVCLGLVMVASAAGAAGFVTATLKRLALTGLGLCAFAVGWQTPYQRWRRWLNVGLPMGLQPSEFVKLAMCVWVAAYCERNAGRMRHAIHGFLAPMAVVGVICLLILAEPDFGTCVLTGAVCTMVLLVFGTRPVFVLMAAAAGYPLLQKIILDVPYRMRRITAFLDPWQDPQGAGYQVIQSKIAIGSGGLFGTGLGAGVQKQGFLPAADNDFIFSIIAEELGLVGALAVIALFLLLLWQCLRVVRRARDPFGFGLALGLSWLLGMQAAAHIAVVTGSVPTKGLSLPFVSAGGSSLIASMWAAGVLINIARSEEEPERHPLKAWREDVPAYELVVRRAARALTRPLSRSPGRAAR